MAELSVAVTLSDTVLSNIYSIVGWSSRSPHFGHVTHTFINRLAVSSGAEAQKPLQMESSMSAE